MTTGIEGMPELAELTGLFAVFAIGAFLIGLVFAAGRAWIWCKICSKTGHSWAMGLLMLVPLGDMFLLLYVAFGQWPIHRELDTLRLRGRIGGDEAGSGALV